MTAFHERVRGGDAVSGQTSQVTDREYWNLWGSPLGDTRWGQDYRGNGVGNTRFECRCSRTGVRGVRVARGRLVIWEEKGSKKECQEPGKRVP